MRAETIDQVIDHLSAIVDRSQREQSSNGYFAALYRRVTERIRDGIRAGEFDDGERMAALDVLFANRYLDAYTARHASEATTRSWALAFDLADQYWPTVLQHLMAGMNAHILLDLGLAAARTAPEQPLENLRRDFAHINGILFALIDQVQDQLAEIWRPFALADRIVGRLDEELAELGMEKSRNSAWEVAVAARNLQGDALATYTLERDRHVCGLGQLIRRPPPLLSLKLGFVRVCERGSVAERIAILARPG